MDNKLAKKYLEAVSMDVGSLEKHMAQYHKDGLKSGSRCCLLGGNGGKKRFLQTEFEFKSPEQPKAKTDEEKLKDYEKWIMSVRDSAVIARELNRFDDGKHEPVVAIIQKAIDRLWKSEAEREMDRLGEMA